MNTCCSPTRSVDHHRHARLDDHGRRRRRRQQLDDFPDERPDVHALRLAARAGRRARTEGWPSISASSRCMRPRSIVEHAPASRPGASRSRSSSIQRARLAMPRSGALSRARRCRRTDRAPGDAVLQPASLARRLRQRAIARRLRLLALDAQPDGQRRRFEPVELLVSERLLRKDPQHANEDVPDHSGKPAKETIAFPLGPCLVRRSSGSPTTSVCQARTSFLRDRADLELSDRHAAVRSVEVRRAARRSPAVPGHARPDSIVQMRANAASTWRATARATC